MSKYFSGVRGQDRAVKILASQLDSKNLSHAYLFLGKNGSGKEHLARIFSRYVLCGSGKEDDCPSCRSFEKFVHPDFVYINGAEGIKIEDVRKAIERINLSPNLSQKKVLLATNVENMSIEAANALLKTLEEPPVDSIIILSAVTEKSLPQTIVSRAQLIKLNVLRRGDVSEILSKESVGDDLEKIIGFSDGNIEKAKQMIADRSILEGHQRIYEEVEIMHKSESIIERFKIIEKHDKSKSLKDFFDAYSRYIFEEVADRLERKEDVASEVGIGKEILKIYANLNYNVSLRISLEKIALKEYLNV